MNNEFDPIHGGLQEEIRKTFGKDGLHWSCLGNDGERKFRMLIEMALATIPEEPRILEIGTHRGVSTTILAQFGCVMTYDIIDWPLRHKVWEHFGVTGRIHSVVLNSSVEKGNALLAAALNEVDFHLAFVDGNHEYESVKANFQAVKKCGRVIFHDFTYNQRHIPRTVRFVNQISHGRITKMPPFALWESLDHVTE